IDQSNLPEANVPLVACRKARRGQVQRPHEACRNPGPSPLVVCLPRRVSAEPLLSGLDRSPGRGSETGKSARPTPAVPQWLRPSTADDRATPLITRQRWPLLPTQIPATSVVAPIAPAPASPAARERKRRNKGRGGARLKSANLRHEQQQQCPGRQSQPSRYRI